MTYEDRHFAEETWPVEEQPKPEFKVGDVYRMNDFSPFMDAVILGISKDGYCKVARPYLYATSTGTTAPTALVGYEQFDIELKSLREHWRKVGDGRVHG